MAPFRRRMSVSQKLCATVVFIAYSRKILRSVTTKDYMNSNPIINYRRN